MLSTEQSSPTTPDTGTKKQSACSRKGMQALFYMGLKARRRWRIQYPHHKPHDLDHQEYKEYRSRCCGDRFPCLRLKDLLHCDKEKADRCTHGNPIIPLVFPPFRVPYTSLCRRFLLRLSLRRRCLYSLRIRVCFLRRALRRHHRLRAADRRFLRRLVK